MTGPLKPTSPNPSPRHAAARRPDSPAPASAKHPASRESAPPQSPPLILASASPRRQSLLREAGYAFSITVSNVDESNHPPHLSAEQFARHLAERKARAVAAEFPDAVVLAADTVVEADGRIIGKPKNLYDAHRILRRLAGTTHSVITAVAVIRLSTSFAEMTAVHSSVHMRSLTPAELKAYLATNQWQGKAGAYGIQDNDPFVTRITGCHTNIVGLPMTTTAALLAQAGIRPDSRQPA
jgi:septum formation protein